MAGALSGDKRDGEQKGKGAAQGERPAQGELTKPDDCTSLPGFRFITIIVRGLLSRWSPERRADERGGADFSQAPHMKGTCKSFRVNPSGGERIGGTGKGEGSKAWL